MFISTYIFKYESFRKFERLGLRMPHTHFHFFLSNYTYLPDGIYRVLRVVSTTTPNISKVHVRGYLVTT